MINLNDVRHVRQHVRHDVRHQTLINKGLCGTCGISLYTHARTRAHTPAHPRMCTLMHAAHAARAAQASNGAGVMPHIMPHKSADIAHTRSRARVTLFFTAFKKMEEVV